MTDTTSTIDLDVPKWRNERSINPHMISLVQSAMVVLQLEKPGEWFMKKTIVEKAEQIVHETVYGSITPAEGRVLPCDIPHRQIRKALFVAMEELQLIFSNEGRYGDVYQYDPANTPLDRNAEARLREFLLYQCSLRPGKRDYSSDAYQRFLKAD